MSKAKLHFDQYSPIRKLSVLNTECIVQAKNNKANLSVIIPTFKRPDTLFKTLDSVIDQITDIKYEIIIVDNDSEREFLDEIKLFISDKNVDYVSYYCNKENLGMFNNWNIGIILAKSEWLTILHDDDWFADSILEYAWQNIKRFNPTMLFFEPEIVDQRKNYRLPLYKKMYRMYKEKRNKTRLVDKYEYFFENLHLGTLGVFFKKELMFNVGGFEPSFFPYTDYLTWFKYVLNNEKVIKVGIKKQCYYRIASNESLKPETIEKSCLGTKELRYEFLEEINNTNTFCKIFTNIKYKYDLYNSYMSYSNKKVFCLNRNGLICTKLMLLNKFFMSICKFFCFKSM